MLNILGWSLWVLVLAYTVVSLITFLMEVFIPNPFEQPSGRYLTTGMKRLISGLTTVEFTVLLILTAYNISKLHLLWLFPIVFFFGTRWVEPLYEWVHFRATRKIAIESCGGFDSFNKKYEEWIKKPWNVGPGELYQQEYAWYYAKVWDDGIDDAYREMLEDDTIKVHISKECFIKQTSNYYMCIYEPEKVKSFLTNNI